MAIYTTGRTRTVTWEGAIAGATGRTQAICDSGQVSIETNDASLSVKFLPLVGSGFEIVVLVGQADPVGTPSPTSPPTCTWFESDAEYEAARAVSIDDGLGGTASDTDVTSYGPGIALPVVMGGVYTGTWSVTLDLEEVMEVVDMDSSKVDLDNFPKEPTLDGSNVLTGYGTAIKDHLEGKRVRFFERALVGGSLDCSVACGGASCSTSTTITGGNTFDLSNTDYTCIVLPGCQEAFDLPATGNTLAAYMSTTSLFEGSKVTGDVYAKTRAETYANGDAGFAEVGITATPTSGLTAYLEYGGNAPIEYQFVGRAGTPDGGNGSTVVNVHKWAGEPVEQVTLNPTGGHTWEQHSYAYQATLAGVLETLEGLDDVTDPRVWADVDTLTASGDDAEDWRMQFLGARWNAFTLVQEPSYVLDDGSSATGWAGSGVTVNSTGGNLVFS